MEDLEYWLDPELLEAVVADIRRLADERSGLVKRIVAMVEEVRAVLRPAKIPRYAPSWPVYAVDGSHTSLELVGGVLTVYSYGYASNTGDRRVSGGVVMEDVEERRVEWLVELLVRKLAARLVERREPRVVLIDGEMGVHPLPYNLAVKGGAYERANTVMNRLLDAVGRRGAALIGVVKRVRSKLTSAVLGKCLGINDRAVATIALRPGEYAVLGRLEDLAERWAVASYGLCARGGEEAVRCYLHGTRPRTARGARLCVRIREAVRNMQSVFDSADYPALRLFRDMLIVLYRPSIGAPAVKAEIIGLDAADAVAYLDATTSPTTGLPQLLDAVDRLVAIPRALPLYTLNMLVRSVGESGAELFTRLASMQKAWLIGLDVA